MNKLKTKILGLENATSNAVFGETNEIVEKCSKIGIYGMKCVFVSCTIFPKAIVSFFNYFTTAAGNDAFDLPLPMWQVFYKIFMSCVECA